MIILGFDPGYAITGYGVIDQQQGRLKPLDYGVITTASDMPFEHRLLRVFEGARALLQHWKPAVIAVEELFFSNNKTTGIGTAQARGAVLIAAAEGRYPVYEYTPMQIKKAVTGYGKAQKQQVQLMVQQLLNLKQKPKPDDAADALAVAICQANMGQLERFKAVGGYQ